MRYGSLCSGIEAATAAWHPLGWKPEFFSEIDKFPSAVLAHHYPDTPNLGDMTKFEEWPDAAINVLVGGTPCQSFSVAGLRKGLDDPRGSLMLTFGAIAAKYRPRWLVWENVPGVLSSNGGRDFGAFLGMLGQLGYGFAYRVLDAQFFGVAQRRRRVFVVGCLGDWRSAAAVLFEQHSLSGYPAPRREAGQGVAGTFKACAGSGGWSNSADHAAAGYMIPAAHAPLASPALKARDHKGPSSDGDGDGAPLIAHSLRGEGFDASEDGTGRGTPIVPVMTLAIRGRDGSPSLEAREDGTANAILTPNGGRAGIGVGAVAIPQAKAAMQVRRLTPVECERLQGFPDNFTRIPYRNKPADKCPDGPRYKALGNSMAVPCMAWLGQRIQMVDALRVDEAAQWLGDSCKAIDRVVYS